MTRSLLLLIGLLSMQTLSQNQPASPSPYDVDEAYGVYSVLLPHQESYEFAKGTLVIQLETVSIPVERQCLSAAAARKFKEAIADYEQANSKKWLLQHEFQSEKPYELVSSDTIKAVFNEHSWETFYRRYPGSGGYMTMSAVGFNSDKSLALVYTGSACGGLCGAWSFHVLEKINGKWKEAAGVQCFTVS